MKMYLLLPVVLLLATGQAVGAKSKPSPRPRIVKIVGQALLDKKPMAGGVVTFCRQDGKAVKAVVDKKGRFTFKVAPGQYQASVRYKGRDYSKQVRVYGGRLIIGPQPVQNVYLSFWTRDKKHGGGR